MKKRIFWAGIVATAVVLVTGGILASNMGFKLNLSLVGPAGGSTGTNLVALPFNQQTSIVDSQDWLSDIDSCAGGSSVTLISRYVRSTDAVSFYDCSGTTSPFNLVPGDAYFVQMNTDQSYIVVGSHDPSLMVHLAGPAGGSTGTNPYAYPYHSVASSSAELVQELDSCAGGSAVTLISRYVKSNDTVAFYDCSGTTSSYSLSPGEGYLIQVNTDLDFVPNHY